MSDRALGLSNAFSAAAPRRPLRKPALRFELLEARQLLSATSEVVGRHIFYDSSSFDDRVAGPSFFDDNAIATDKAAYLPGGVRADGANATSYSRGINGIMIDLAGTHGEIGLDDFRFRVGQRSDSFGTWSDAPAPSGFSVRPGAGTGGSDRVTITWPDGAIRNTWLETIVVAGDDTGLGTSDVFLFGNRVGDTFDGSPPISLVTNATDSITARLSGTLHAGITHPADFDRSGFINATDEIIARTNSGFSERIAVGLTAPRIDIWLANDTAPGGTTNDDRLTRDPAVDLVLSAPEGIARVWARLDGGEKIEVTDILSDSNGRTAGLHVDAALYESLGGAPLADGAHELAIELLDEHGQNTVSRLAFTLQTSAIDLALTSAVSVTDDRTPHLTITTEGPGAPDQVAIDVDLNYDGDFDDAGERGYGSAELYLGRAYFQLNPALPATGPDGLAYFASIRARYEDAAGNEGVSEPTSLYVDTIGNSVLEDYVQALDPSYRYSLVRVYNNELYTTYVLDMTSQTWRTTAEVNRTAWRHYVQILVPKGEISNSALLFIDGGGNSSNPPGAPDPLIGVMVTQLKSVAVLLPTVPNQPLFFTDEPGNSQTEDEIIAYSFDKYLDNYGQPGHETWPLLLPMVKSAKAAMDAVQSFVPSVASGLQINDFIVSGYSKRGWTTWLTAAVDDRVKAIIPGVIDVPNMDEQMLHHHELYDDFSAAIHDYVDRNIMQRMFTPEGQALLKIVDPYSYFGNGRFDDMPKLLINASGDEFFVPNSSQYYFSDIPGTQNYLRYVPNSGHGIDVASAAASTIGFVRAVINGQELPEYSWTTRWDGQITAEAATTPSRVVVWRATNPDAREFRRSFTSINWTSTVLTPSPDGKYRAEAILPPGGGAHAFFIEFTFPNPAGIPDFVFTTEISVVDTFAKPAWPYFMPVNPPPGDELALALAIASDAGGDDVAISPLPIPLVSTVGRASRDEAVLALLPADESEPIAAAAIADDPLLLMEDEWS